MKKILAIALMVCMLVTVVLPLSISAEEITYGGTVTVSCGEESETFSEANFAAAIKKLNGYTAGDAVLTFNGNVDYNGNVRITVPCTIVGNGYTFKGSQTDNALKLAGTLSDKTVVATYVKDLTVLGYGGVAVYDGTNTLLENVNVTTTNNHAVYVVDAGWKKLEISGGTYKATNNGINYYVAQTADTEIIISDATFTAGAKKDVIKVNGSKLTVNSGTFTGAGGTGTDDSVISVFSVTNNGCLTINNGTFKATNKCKVLSFASGENTINNGTFTSTSTGDVLSLTNDGDLTVYGGTFTSTSTGDVLSLTNGGDLTVYGGTFTASGNGEAISYEGSSEINIYGGDFSSTSGHCVTEVDNKSSGSVLNIYGGTLTSKLEYVTSGQTNDYAKGKDVIVTYDKNGSKASVPNSTINIYGGVLTGGRSVINMHSNDATDLKNAVVNVYGGELNAKNHAVFTYNIGAADKKNNADVNIYGGYMAGSSIFEGCFRGSNRDDDGITGTINVYGGTLSIDKDGSVTLGRCGKTTFNMFGGDIYVTGTRGDKTFYVFPSSAMTAGTVSGYRLFMRSDLTIAERDGKFDNSTKLNGTFKVNGFDCVAYIDSKVYAETNGVANKGITIEDGAAIRLVDDENGNGIRFTAHVSADTVNYVKTTLKGENVKYGTILFNADSSKLAGVSIFTIDSFKKAGLVTGESNYDYILIDAKDGLDGSDTDGYTMRTALTGIKNNSRKFGAIPYVSYEIDGHTVYLYGQVYVAGDNSRSMEYVAYRALGDAKAEDYEARVAEGYSQKITEGYTVSLNGYEDITVSAGMYVPYTAEQRELLATKYGITVTKIENN